MGEQKGETLLNNGYYGCSLPPGACHCPQGNRRLCSHSHWVDLPTRDAQADAMLAHLCSPAFSETAATPKPAPDAMRKLADQLIGIQEDLPNEDDRNALGFAAHYLRKFAPVPSPDRAGTSQGLCDTTLTERFSNPVCRCDTYTGNLGPCKTFEVGASSRCVYCDHEFSCHLSATAPAEDKSKCP